MAIPETNTTATLGRTSDALREQCESTQKNLRKLMKEAGAEDAEKVKMVKTIFPLIPGSKDDVIFAGLNGARFYFRRGVQVEVPEPIMQLLQECGRA